MMYATTFIVLLACIFAYVITVPGRRKKNMPHGPRTLPIIGNLHQIPPKKTYLKFAEWATTYGELHSVKIASSNTVVVSSRRLVKELMDKKNSLSSFRPKSYALNKLIYEGDYLLLMDSNDPRFRAGRKFIHQYFMESMVDAHHLPVLNAEATQLVRDLCDNPDDFPSHARRYANSFIMSVTYGVRTPSIHTPHLAKIEYIIENLTKLILPGKLPPIDIFPFLRWVPERLLGNWKTHCLDIQKETNALYSELMNLVLERRKEEGPKNFYADKLIENQEKLGLSWHELIYLTGIMIDAGSDTTSSGIMTFIQMMAKFPHALKQAQAQINSVVGEDRTPTWDDFPRLPIVNALIKEVQRFRPLVPIAFPHRLSQDVWLDGKLLPKDSTIVVNIPGIHNDPAKFPEPSHFDPSHFEGMTAVASEYANAADYEARDHYGYGFGRRLCPGIHVAERSLFVTFSKLIWAFDISPAKDGNGNEIGVDISLETGYTDGAIVQPIKFPCKITPRSNKRRETIMKEFEEVERKTFSQFKVPKETAAFV